MTFAQQAEHNLAVRDRDHVSGAHYNMHGGDAALALFLSTFPPGYTPKIDARHCPRYCTHSQEGAESR